jgi:hypothetical protein
VVSVPSGSLRRTTRPNGSYSIEVVRPFGSVTSAGCPDLTSGVRKLWCPSGLPTLAGYRPSIYGVPKLVVRATIPAPLTVLLSITLSWSSANVRPTVSARVPWPGRRVELASSRVPAL